MALPNLSGSNIQETYQRVLHTDGTNIYDGTGSVFIPATASYAVSASYEINYETSSSYAETASFSNEFRLKDGAYLYLGDGTGEAIKANGAQVDIYAGGYQRFSATNLTATMGAPNANFLPTVKIYASSSEFLGDITASGNISASGNMSAGSYSNIYLSHETESKITFPSRSKLTLGSTWPSNERITIAADPNGISGNGSIKFIIAGGEAMVLNDGSNKILIGYGGGIDEVAIGSATTQAIISTFGSSPKTQIYGRTIIGKFGYTSNANTGDATSELVVTGSSNFLGPITASTYVSVPSIIAQSSLRMATFNPAKIYYGHANGWQVGGYTANVNSSSTWLPAAGGQHNYIQVPFGYKNLSMMGTVQVPHAAAGTKFQVLKAKRMDGGNSFTQPTTSIMLDYTHTNTTLGESRFYNFDVTSSNSISAGEQLLFIVDPTGSDGVIKCTYTIHGETI
jgi:hypothetical protein